MKMIETEKIRSGKNVRNEHDDSIQELMENIEQYGLLNPILVAKSEHGLGYECIAGHRRLEAVRRLGEPFIECNIIDLPGIRDRIGIQVSENVQRKAMSALELVDIFNQLKKEGLSQQKIAQLFKKSQSWVSTQYCAAKYIEDYAEEHGGEIPADFMDSSGTKCMTRLYKIHNAEKLGGKKPASINWKGTKETGLMYLNRSNGTYTIRVFTTEKKALLENFLKEYAHTARAN